MAILKRAEGVRLLVSDRSPLAIAGHPAPANERLLTFDFTVSAADGGFLLAMACREEPLYEESWSAELAEAVAEGELWGVPPGAWADAAPGTSPGGDEALG